jgi:hypothetical protein
LENYFELKFRLWKEHEVNPEWIESIPFYEYQIWIEKLNIFIEKENKKSLNESGKTELFNFSNR